MLPRTPPSRRRASPKVLAAAAAAWTVASPVSAQDAGQAGGVTVTPTFAAEESYLETRGRISGENGREAVTRLSPGLHLSSRSGRVQGSLDYAGNLLYRMGRGESEGREFQNSLNASVLAELVANRAFLDASATVSQQSISAFGQQSAAGSLQDNANRSEVATITLSPSARGSFGGAADYEVRLNASASNSKDATASNSRSSGGSVVLHSPRSGALLGWAVSVSQQRSEFTANSNGALDNSRANASINVTPVPELQFSLSGGSESVDDGAQAERRSTNTANLGMQWSPSQRTSLNVDVGERYFGRSSRVSFSHRSPRSVWSYSYSRDVTNGAAGLSQPQTLFQLYFAQATSGIPDPAARQQYVLALLASLGLDPNQIVAPGFLTSSTSLQSRQDLSFAWLGLRTTLSVQAFTNSQSQLTTVGDADPTTGEAVRQHGYNTSLSYRLTPQTAVSFGGSRLMTFATSAQAGTDLKSASINLTSQVGRRTSAQLGARYAVFNSSTDPYRETSVSASLNLRY